MTNINVANGGSNLPRADVSNGALAGAMVTVLIGITQGQADLAVYGSAATVIVQFLVSYFLPQYKVAANGIAGAVVTVVIGVISLSQGLPLDEGAFQTAVTFLVTFILTAVIPPRQP